MHIYVLDSMYFFLYKMRHIAIPVRSMTLGFTILKRVLLKMEQFSTATREHGMLCVKVIGIVAKLISL